MAELIEQHECTSVGEYERRRPTGTCTTCGQPYDSDVHHVVPEGWCQWDQEEHAWPVGALECTRCGAEAPEDELCEGCGNVFLEADLNEDGYCEVCKP
jgi:hypothetical protein